MQVLKREWKIGILFLVCLGIHWLSRMPVLVEKIYFKGFYIRFSAILAGISGFFPFSIGDILYYLIIMFVISRLWLFVKKIRKHQGIERRLLVLRSGKAILILLLTLYCLFNIFWGLNYNRPGLSKQLDIQLVSPDQPSLLQLAADLLDSVNRLGSMPSNGPFRTDSIFIQAGEAYREIVKNENWLHSHEPVVRYSFFGWLGKYAGFTGYYNPFTAESNVIEDIPDWMQPFVACHELAHQWGYAKEMEANMVGFLAAAHARDTKFKYAAYLEMWMYTYQNLNFIDSAAANQLSRRLSDQARKDLMEWKAYLRKHRSFLDPLFTKWYDFYLRKNQQPRGIGSYAQVTAFLIAYKSRFGHY